MANFYKIVAVVVCLIVLFIISIVTVILVVSGNNMKKNQFQIFSCSILVLNILKMKVHLVHLLKLSTLRTNCLKLFRKETWIKLRKYWLILTLMWMQKWIMSKYYMTKWYFWSFCMDYLIKKIYLHFITLSQNSQSCTFIKDLRLCTLSTYLYVLTYLHCKRFQYAIDFGIWTWILHYCWNPLG